MNDTTWWGKTMGSVEVAKKYMRGENGVPFLSRKRLLELVNDGESLLDVGCGPAVTYENFKTNNRDIKYKGVDYSPIMVKAAQELYPEANFEVQDAQALKENTKSFDVVLIRHALEHIPDWKKAIQEGIRVSKKRLIVILWTPFGKSRETTTHSSGEGHIHHVFGRVEIDFWVRNLNRNVTIEENVGKSNVVIVFDLKKDVILDMDDFLEKDDKLPGFDYIKNDLFAIKKEIPNFKINLFTIMDKCTKEFLKEIKKNDWISLCLHGRIHHPNTECELWTYDDMMKYLDDAEEIGVFSKVFRAPGWIVSREACRALKDRDYIIASLESNWTSRLEQKMYKSDHPWLIHSHTRSYCGQRWTLPNGFKTLIESNRIGIDNNTKFHFIKDVIK